MSDPLPMVEKQAMSTRVRANCPDCGEVRFTTADMQLDIWPDTFEGTYHFACPSCGEEVHDGADLDVVEMLLNGGAPVRFHDSADWI